MPDCIERQPNAKPPYSQRPDQGLQARDQQIPRTVPLNRKIQKISANNEEQRHVERIDNLSGHDFREDMPRIHVREGMPPDDQKCGNSFHKVQISISCFCLQNFSPVIPFQTEGLSPFLFQKLLQSAVPLNRKIQKISANNEEQRHVERIDNLSGHDFREDMPRIHVREGMPPDDQKCGNSFHKVQISISCFCLQNFSPVIPFQTEGLSPFLFQKLLQSDKER